jgi:hypothetical protein
MSESEYQLLRDQISDLKGDMEGLQELVAKVQSRMVTKAEWLPIKRQYEVDHETIKKYAPAFEDWQKFNKYIKRLGWGVLAGAWLSPHLVPIAKAIGEGFRMGLLGGK